MQIVIIVLGVVLVLAGLYFAVGGFGQGSSGGGFRDMKMEGPPWLILVAIGVGLVVYGSTWEAGQDPAPRASVGEAERPAITANVPIYKFGDTTWTTSTKAAGIVDWAQASAYCSGLNAGGLAYRLPTIAELQSIADPNDPNAWDRKIARIFHDGIGSNWIWSADVDGAGAAFYFDFETLGVSSSARNSTVGIEALCVGE
ncbi:DUF1566 domain-containing protein [Halieaceae bacterium IMCC14734]|uniref:DUF1566 domain-containing protein n=1 Tax=Candidatus Litorirhabdus singularis TaxID=2518993 RepID=A0ABT3TF58_9GAMM|nr:DUF1566 domain-containing protein [Candidatus Litorirhabdus singularis]MCX2980644.1 DUF1566 domain-containing protein [Candidatus Litorirhabdus singularis]